MRFKFFESYRIKLQREVAKAAAEFREQVDGDWWGPDYSPEPEGEEIRFLDNPRRQKRG